MACFTSPEYYVRGWLEDRVKGGDPRLLGEVSILILGGGFRLVPRVLGDSVEDISGLLTTVKVWRLRDKPVSVIALAGGSHYVEAVLAMICFSSVKRIYALGWCGSLHPDVKIGDVVVAYAAMRGDATSTWYIPLEYPAVAEPHDVLEVYEAAKREGLRTHMGIVYTTSSHMREAEILEK